MKKEPSKGWLEFRQNAPRILRECAGKALRWCRDSFSLERDRALEQAKAGLRLKNHAAWLLLCLCAVLPTSTALKSGLGTGLFVTVVLLLSNLMVALLRRQLPDAVRVAVHVVITLTAALAAELVFKAYVPEFAPVEGLLLPLVAVESLLSARAEAAPPEDKPGHALLGGLMDGLGFTLALCVLSALRELLGRGSLWGASLTALRPALLVAAPCGGFLLLGLGAALCRRLSRLLGERGRKT